MRRIEKGFLNTREELVDVLLNYFGIKLKYTLYDQNEINTLEALLSSDLPVRECIEEASGKIYEHRAMYRGDYSLYGFRITNLIQLLIYIPFFDKDDIIEALARIGGEFRGNEIYALEQLDWLYSQIPESKYKEAADELSEHLLDMENISKAALETYRQFLGLEPTGCFKDLTHNEGISINEEIVRSDVICGQK